jgi:predicted nuclease of restriction endonuclease-like (RecB) superfamily
MKKAAKKATAGKERGLTTKTGSPGPSTFPDGYRAILVEIKQRVQRTQVRAALSANAELVALYWDIGKMILERQTREGWGTKVIDRLAADLQAEFPGRQGFSPRNLKYMRAFAEAWPGGLNNEQVLQSPPAKTSIVQQPVAQLQSTPIVQSPLAQLPWRHHTILLDKLDRPEDRLWYARAVIENGWSGNILALQIESGLHLRQGKATTNFKRALPPDQSDLAQSITKDPYLFDFLGLTGPNNERTIEEGLIAHVEKFLLELGNGFALVGRQLHLEIGEQDFYLDLLFYHWKLRAFIVIDLKARDFTPEAAGKMNFYLSAVDDLYKQPGDQPSLGLILCRNKNRVLAEYALRDMTKPIGVSGYVTQLVEQLPKNLRGTIPTVKEIENELSR